MRFSVMAAAMGACRRWCTPLGWGEIAVLSHHCHDPCMPHKHNADRRHHIPKMAFKVRNWPAYEAGLRRRGSLTLWIEDAALSQWQTVGPSGQARYSDAAIQTTLMVRTAFKRPFRQTEGLIASVMVLMALTLSAPDHTTMSRRTVRLPVVRQISVPHGPLHLLIDSTGLKVYGGGNGWKRSTARYRGGHGASCIWRWMPPTARSSPRP